MKISKQIKFDSAHMLSGYEGKCANLHGHTYTGEIEVEGSIDEESGMLIDYNDIKSKVDMFDHAIIFSGKKVRGKAEEELLEWADKYEMNYIELPSDKKCTAENIAEYLAAYIWSGYTNVSGVVVVLHETVGSTARGEVVGNAVV